jgi:3-hydroxypropionyl-CoA synthetase (ADP-forming)
MSTLSLKLSRKDLTPATRAERTLAAMRAAFPPYFVVGNPLDVTGSATSKDYDAGLAFLLGDANVDLVMAWFVFQDAPLDEGIIEVLASLPARFPGKPILCGASGGAYTGRISREIESRGVPVLATVTEWLAAAAALTTRLALPGPDLL